MEGRKSHKGRKCKRGGSRPKLIAGSEGQEYKGKHK